MGTSIAPVVHLPRKKSNQNSRRGFTPCEQGKDLCEVFYNCMNFFIQKSSFYICPDIGQMIEYN